MQAIAGDDSELAEVEEQRKKRLRKDQFHNALIIHATTCITKCPFANCAKMKGILNHPDSCKIKASGGCVACKRTLSFLQLHARQCKAGSECPVPHCMAIRERVRQHQKQQQAINDQRRQEMKRLYGNLS